MVDQDGNKVAPGDFIVANLSSQCVTCEVVDVKEGGMALVLGTKEPAINPAQLTVKLTINLMPNQPTAGVWRRYGPQMKADS